MWFQVSASFFSVKPVLKCLQDMPSVPLATELVHGAASPALTYITPDVAKKVRVGSPGGWDAVPAYQPAPWTTQFVGQIAVLDLLPHTERQITHFCVWCGVWPVTTLCSTRGMCMHGLRPSTHEHTRARVQLQGIN